METLRFLMVTTHYPPDAIGGDAIFVKYLSEELTRRGHEVHVFCNPSVHRILRGRTATVERHQEEGRPTIHRFSNTVVPFQLMTAYSLGASKGPRKRLAEIEKEVRPDVVHWHNAKGFFGAPVESKNATMLYTAHDYFSVCPRSNLMRPDFSFCSQPRLCQVCLLRWKRPPMLWRIGDKRVIRIPQKFKILSPSEYMARRLEQDGIQPFKILRNFVPDPGKQASAKEPTAVTYVGILERHKGLGTLVDAFAKSSKNHDFELFIIGEGRLKETLRQKVEHLGLSKRISVTGFLSSSELTSVLHGSSALILPSEWPENSPLVALEALALGIPIIGSRIGGIPEILGKESGSTTFEAGNIVELSQKISDCWTERKGQSEARRMTRRHYETHFSPDIHVSDYLAIIGA